VLVYVMMIWPLAPAPDGDAEITGPVREPET
jgi:hypothetical protein